MQAIFNCGNKYCELRLIGDAIFLININKFDLSADMKVIDVHSSWLKMTDMTKLYQLLYTQHSRLYHEVEKIE